MNKYKIFLNKRICFWLLCLSLMPNFNTNNFSWQAAKAQTKPESNNLIADSREKYQKYMEAGLLAEEQRDYRTAWLQYQKALSSRPDDPAAQAALKRVENYAYDSYMQSGYAADQAKNFRQALQFFEQALVIRPDSFHAQQAVSNVKKYLAKPQIQQLQTTNKPGNNQPSLIPFNWVWLGVGAGGLLGVGLFLGKFFGQNNLLAQSSEQNLDQTNENSPFLDLTSNNKHEQNSQPPPPQKISPINNHQNNTNNTIPQPTGKSETITVENGSNIAKFDIITELIADLNHTNAKIRKKAIWELAQRSDSRAMKPLVQLMIDADSQERSLILEAISQIAARTLKPLNKALTISLEDENAQVRKNAIRDLTRVYDLMSQVTKRLSHAIDDTDQEVRETAQWALKQLNHMPEIPDLAKLQKATKNLNSSPQDSLDA